GHVLAYDAARTHTLLFGGNDGTALRADTWEWDGNAWNQRAGTGPTGRAAAGLAFDGVRRRAALGGGGGAGVSGEDGGWGARGDGLPLGQGCAGTCGVPVLAANSAPVPGNATFALRLSGLVPNAFAVYALGFARSLQDFGACRFYLAAPITVASAFADP